MTDTHMGQLLERATADLRPGPDLVPGAITAGRSLRRRGLALAAAGTVAAAGVVGAALVSLPGGSVGDRSVVADDPAGTGGTSLAAQPSAGTSAPADPAHSGPFPVAADAMAETLATLLQDTGTVANPDDDQYHLAAPDGWQSGAVDLDGASVSVSYQHSTGPRCDGDLARGNTSCTALGGGYFLGTYSAVLTSTEEGRTGVHDIGVTYYTPDGYKISATASNAGSADPTHPAMSQPVLGLDALTAIAEDPAWR